MSADLEVAPVPPGADTGEDPRGILERLRHWLTRPGPGGASRGVLMLVALVTASAVALVLFLRASDAGASGAMPENIAMEQSLGIRVTAVSVVGDDGLVQVDYLCLDAEKATRFQSDTAHPPVLRSEVRDRSTQRVSLMKKGHQMRPGQTYYFLYLNAGTVHSGERASLSYGGFTLAGIPVR